MTKFIKLFLAVILLAGCSKKNDESNLTVLTGGGEVSYKVEEAKTVPELEKGLMSVSYTHLTLPTICSV